MKIRILLALLCGLAVAARGGQQADRTIGDLNSLIQAAVSSHDARVVIPPGIYRGPAPFLSLQNVSDLEIIADGVTMICETKVRALALNNCKNVKIKGLTIDYYPLTFTQGDIIAVTDSYVDVRIHDGYDVAPYSRIDIIDPATRFRKRGSVFVWNSTAELAADGVVRVYQPDLKVAARVGDMASMSTGPEGTYGAPHVLEIGSCRGGMVLEDVTVHCGPGFGIFESGGTGGTHLKNCRIVPGPPPPGATQERLLSVSWDAIQHSLTHTGPIVEGCEVRDAGDDSWSVTWDGNYVISGLYASNRRLTLADSRDRPLQAGDTLRASLHSDYAVIAEKSGDLLILDRASPWPVGARLYSPNRRCEHFILRNNRFRSSGRILIKAGHGLIENNLIEDGHCGVIVNSECDLTAISDLVIRNNVIAGSGHFNPAPWSNQAGAISLADGASPDLAPAGSFERIVVENNTFRDVSGVNMVFASTADLSVKGNVFYETGLTTPNSTGSAYGIDQNCVVYIKNCHTVSLDSNAVVGRELSRLLTTSGVTALTSLRGGVFDAAPSATVSPASPDGKITWHYREQSLVFTFPADVNESAVLSVYNALGQLEEKMTVECKKKEVKIPCRLPASGMKMIHLQGKSFEVSGKVPVG
ncbi:MAG: right-handed parallel beta-helix repeat-containing protein [Tannerella sp.]|nr:right-handed parallel beta-helix repeat-containing protein [Tannerella sp.]